MHAFSLRKLHLNHIGGGAVGFFLKGPDVSDLLQGNREVTGAARPSGLKREGEAVLGECGPAKLPDLRPVQIALIENDFGCNAGFVSLEDHHDV